jgi:hypothetical protein
MDIMQYVNDEALKKFISSIDDEKINQFTSSIQNCEKMDSQQMQTVVDEISAKQPHLMLEITNLKKIGVYQEQYQDIIKLFIILYRYFNGGGKTELPVVTEKIIQDVKTNLYAYITWQQDEEPEEMNKLLVRMLMNHPEAFAFGYVSSYINSNSFPNDMPGSAECYQVARVILDCLVRVKKEFVSRILGSI